MPRRSKFEIGEDQIDTASGVYRDDEGKRTVQIGEFDLDWLHPRGPDDVEHASKIVIIGKPGSGKTNLAEDILLSKAWFIPVIQVFHGSENEEPFWNKCVPSCFIFDSLDSDLENVKRFTQRQSIAIQHLENPWAAQVFDDVTDKPEVLKSPVMKGIFKRGRHQRMLHMELIQYPMDIDPAMRSCVDYTFIASNSILSERRKIYENFGSGCIPTFQDFCDVLDQVTEDHTFLVIDNTSQKAELSSRVFYYKTNLDLIPKDWRFGSNEIWEFDKDRRDPNYRPSLL